MPRPAAGILIGNQFVDPNLIAWWLSGTLDKSGNGKTLTLANNAEFTGTGPVGTPLVLGGSGDKATFDKITISGDASIALWMRGSSAVKDLLSYATAYTDYNLARATYFESKMGNVRVDYSAIIPDAVTWQHLVLKRTGTTRYAYLNGVRLTAINSGGSGDWQLNTLGASANGVNYSWIGAIDDARIYDKALSDDEVITLYNYGPTPLTQQLILDIEGSITDLSDAGNNLTLSGDAAFSGVGPVSTPLVLDGTGDWATAAGADFQWGAEHKTVSMWVRCGTEAAVQNLIGNYVGATQGWDISINAQEMTSRSLGGSSRTRTTFFNNDGMWHHIAAVFDTISLKNLFDGVSYGGAAGGWTPTASNTDLFIGTNSAAGTPFNGWIDGLRISDRILTDAEILTLYEGDIAASSAQDKIGVMFGDSLTAGTGATWGNIIPVQLQAAFPGKAWFNQGEGGRTAEATADAFILADHFHHSFVILWDAYAADCVTPWNRALQVAKGEYIILGCATTSETDAAVRATNSAMEAAYGNRFIDIYQAMIDETGQSDYADFRVDTVHLNDAGYTFITGLIVAKMTELGI